MITWMWKKLPIDENGNAYNSLDSFKVAMLMKILGIEGETAAATCDAILENKADVISILNITMDARPKARGVPKPRRSKTKAAPEPELPIKAA